MSRPPDYDDGNGRWYSRRSVLRTSVATLGAVGGVGGVASAQEETETPGEAPRTTNKAVLLELEEFEDLTGFFIHVEGRPSPIEASVADACDFVNWENENTSAYDVVVLDRSQADVPQTRTTLYLHESKEVPPGALWVINRQEPCEGGYIGTWIEQIGATELEAALSGDVSPTETEAGVANGDEGGEILFDAAGPGFGVVAGAAGMLGGGWLLSRDREE